MHKLLLDIEVTVQYRDGRTDPSPYNPLNSLISLGYQVVGGEKGYLFFHPNYASPAEIAANVKKVQDLLDNSSLVIGHNLKFDMSWLFETGFRYEGKFHDTMIFEYIACKGLKHPVNLEFTAKRYGLSEKKDILKEWIKEKKPLEDMPRDMWVEYGEQDIITTYDVYQHQCKRMEYEQDIKTMSKVITLSNEALACLIDIERAGIQIDQGALNAVEAQFRAEKVKLEEEMRDMTRSVMGDSPINFSSPEHMGWVVYSRKVKDKKRWAEIFNIGSEMRGSVRKTKYPKYYSFNEFNSIVKANTDIVYKTDVTHCVECDGKGHFYKIKKDGEPFARATTCPSCDGEKVVYRGNGAVAGFKVKPISSMFASSSGFSTDKETILQLLERSDTPPDAKVFLTKLSRLNAIDTYLTAFIEGIRNGIKPDGFCHPNFNQCVTATGRLSSSNPNWQNQPRGNTFPVRRVVVSRWSDIGGKLHDIDFCVSPDTKILTTDLRWKEAKDISVGEKLIGFNEQFKNMLGIKLEESIVEKTKVLKKECLRITTTSGVVICSIDHMWVGRPASERYIRNAKWYKAEELKEGWYLPVYVKPWEQNTSWDAAWMAGFLDGEGNISGTAFAVGQKNEGDNAIVWKKAIDILKVNGFDDIGISTNASGCDRIQPRGSQVGMRGLGIFRPERLLAKSRKLWEGRRTYNKLSKPSKILKIEKLGVQEVVAIQTSTKTFIAEGFLSHNCQLEYRTAVELAKCLPGLASIREGKDRHQLTAEVLFGKKKEDYTPDEWKLRRQDAKPDTFAPLYGSMGKDDARKRYKDAFYAEHTGIAKWHDALVTEALTYGQITTPSGRIFSFPNVRRIDATRVIGRTQILNYPVQSFATADIAWCVIVHLWNAMKKAGVKSRIILQVHDSITIDTHPDEIELMQDLIKASFNLANSLLKERFNYDTIVPIGYEISMGDNLMEKKAIFASESKPNLELDRQDVKAVS